MTESDSLYCSAQILFFQGVANNSLIIYTNYAMFRNHITPRARHTCAYLLLLFSASPARAFNQPALNLGLTSLLDGGPVPPGFFLVEYIQHSRGARAVGDTGDAIAGGAEIGAVVNLHQAMYLSPRKLFGAHIGMDLVIPVVSANGKGALGPVVLTAHTPGLGDITIGPIFQWNNSRLLGRPFFQRFEFDVTLPTGKFDPAFSINPGAGILTLNPYYASSWLFAENWRTDIRLFYALHGENGRTRIRPGQAFHMNYALSYALLSNLHLGVSGYLLQQLTEDRIAGITSSASKERAVAIGPAFAYMGKGLMFVLSHPVDISVRNRFKGSRTTLQLIHRF